MSLTKEQDREAAASYADKHAPVVPNQRALVKTVVAEAYLAGLAAARAAAEPPDCPKCGVPHYQNCEQKAPKRRQPSALETESGHVPADIMWGDDEPKASPADLVGALQDRVHEDGGPFRAGRSVKTPPIDNNHVAEGCEKFGERHE